MYCNKLMIERIIAQALTTAAPTDLSTKVDLLKIGNVLDSNVIPDITITQYIKWASEEINSVLSQMYATPFSELADFEECLFADIDDYNTFLTTKESSPFDVEDNVVITDGTHTERHVISEILDSLSRNIFVTLEPISYGFSALNTRIIRVKYPDPIPLTCAMIAASRIYDRYFASQSDVAESKYGSYLRTQAKSNLDNILNGKTILHGAKRIGGTGFYNPYLDRQYSIPDGGQANKNLNDIGR